MAVKSWLLLATLVNPNHDFLWIDFADEQLGVGQEDVGN